MSRIDDGLVADDSAPGGLEPASAASAAADYRPSAADRSYAGLDERVWSGPFYFVQAADTQLGMMANFDPGRAAYDDEAGGAAHRKDWRQEVQLMRRAIAGVNRMRPLPKFLVVCGDLVDAMPGTEDRAEQTRDFKAVLSKLDRRVRPVCVCGNHDVGNTPTPSTVADYTSHFGDDYYTFWCGGCKFVVLNSQLYQDCSRSAELAADQEAWLDAALAAGRVQPQSEADASGSRRPPPADGNTCRHLVVFQHVPPFVRSPDEGAVDVFGDARWCFNFADVPQRRRFLGRLKAAGVAKLFSGHYHRNAGGWDGGLEVVVTSAVGCQLGGDAHGLRIVRVLPDRIEHRYYALAHLPLSIDLPTL